MRSEVAEDRRERMDERSLIGGPLCAKDHRLSTRDHR